MIRAFGDDGRRLHLGGDRVVARARRSLGRQVIGTGIPHDLLREPPSSAVRDVVIGVVEAAFPTRLMTCLRGACGLPSAAGLAVDVAAVIRRAAVEDAPAPGASNGDQHLGGVHGGSPRSELVPRRRPEAPSPRPRPRATEGSGLPPWAFALYAARRSSPTSRTHRHFPATPSCPASGFLRILTIVNTSRS